VKEAVDAAAEAVGGFLDGLRRRQHRICRLVHVSDGAGCSTPTTDFVPQAAAATLSDISSVAAFCCSTDVAMAPVNC